MFLYCRRNMVQKPTTSDRSIRQRLARVYRQWTSTRMILRRFFRDHQLDPPECAFYIAAVVGLFLLQSEKLIWKRLGLTSSASPADGSPDALRDLLWTQPFADLWLVPFDDLDAASSAWLWLGLIVVYPVNAWLFDRWITRTSGAEVSIRPWLRRLRWLLAGVPWLGVAIFPAWRWLLDRQPPWALASDRPPDLARGQPLPLSRRRLPQAFHDFLERLSGSSMFTSIWLVAPNFLALRAALAWLDAPGRLGDVGLISAIVGCAMLHGLAFVCLAYFLAARARERQLATLKQGFLWLQAATLALPMPAAMLAFLTFGQVDGGRLKTILYRLHNSGRYPASLQESVARAGGRLPGPLGWWLGRAESSDDSVARYRRLKLYRLKTFLLLIDVAAIVRLGLWAADKAFVFDLTVGLVLGGTTALAAVGLVISFPACTYQFFLRPARDRAWLHDQDHYPVMRYVMLTSLAFFAGFLLVNTNQDPSDLAESFLLVGAFGFLLAAAFLLPAIGRFFTDGDRDFGLFLWPIPFQMMAQAGYLAKHEPGRMDSLVGLWTAAVLLSPLVSVLVFAWRGRWLLRPLRWRQLMSPGLPRSLRILLIVTVLTAALPLGGVAVPLCIVAHRRLDRYLELSQTPTIEDRAPSENAPNAYDRRSRDHSPGSRRSRAGTRSADW